MLAVKGLRLQNVHEIHGCANPSACLHFCQIQPRPEGVLCREFLSAHLPPCTPVIMAGSGDDTLLSNVGGFEYDKHDSQSPSVVNTDLDAKYHARTSEAEVAQSTCNCAKEERSDEGAGQPRGTVPPRGGSGCIDMTTVGQLYPWRNLYGLTPRGDQLRLGFVRQQVRNCACRSCDLRTTVQCSSNSLQWRERGAHEA